LHDLGIPHLIITLAEDGVLVFENHRPVHIPAYQVEAVDTTAAGDAFVGAFAVALTEGLSNQKAAAWANAAAALSVTRVGAQPSLPNRAELEVFLSKTK
jgi:ribokinase